MAQSKSNHHYATQTNINLKTYHRIFLSSIFRCPDDLINIVKQCASGDEDLARARLEMSRQTPITMAATYLTGIFLYILDITEPSDS